MRIIGIITTGVVAGGRARRRRRRLPLDRRRQALPADARRCKGRRTDARDELLRGRRRGGRAARGRPARSPASAYASAPCTGSSPTRSSSRSRSPPPVGRAEGATTELVVVPGARALHGLPSRLRQLRTRRRRARRAGRSTSRVEGGDEVVLEWLRVRRLALTADSPAELVPAQPSPDHPGDHEGSDRLEPVRSFVITEEG